MSTNDWVATSATIYSAEYIDPQGEGRPCWRVTYSYQVDGHYYSGEFTDFATDSEVEYHKDDSLSIEYSKASPNKSRVPGLTSYWQKMNSPFLVYASVVVIVFLLCIIILSHYDLH